MRNTGAGTRPLAALAGVGLTTAFAALLGVASFTSWASGGKGEKADKAAPVTVAGLTPADLDTFSTRFTKDVWPVMSTQCAPCHAQKNPSQFTMGRDPKATFLQLLTEGFFDVDNHSSLAERVATTDKTIVMPPVTMGKLPRPDIATFTHFAEDLKARRQGASGAKPDEIFPAHLSLPFAGKPQTEGLDNTFLTFRQLRGKIQTVFGDDWVRDDHNLFVENAQMFGGADFIKRFDETAKASPTYFTAVDMMGRDVASRAYLTKSGPFSGLPDTLPAPVGMKSPTPAYAAAINRMYNRMLFRDPTPAETAKAFAFIQGIYRRQDEIVRTGSQDLRFALTVTDDRGMSVRDDVTVRVSAGGHGLYSQFVDQSRDAEDGKNKTATVTLARLMTFAPGDTAQKIFVTNEGTHGNVSVASVTLRGPLPLRDEVVTTVADAGVQPEGAWHIKTDGGFTSYEDNNENKGDSHVTFPVNVAKPGQYEVALTWRRYAGIVAPKPAKPGAKGAKPSGKDFRGAPANGAENVLVEVVSQDKASALALPAPPPVPPRGEAVFFVDETLDTIPFADLKTAFQFGAGDGIELRNDGTRKKVVADAVRLMPMGGGGSDKDAVILRGVDAQGAKQWGTFPTQTFRPYNIVGPVQYQDTDDDGTKRDNLRLAYRPAAAKEGFSPAKFYRIGVVYPGRVENETRVPVVVHAQASSPIVQVVAPFHASVGAPVTLDASSSFNLQHSALRYRWTQIGGPRVALTNPAAPALHFPAPQLGPGQAAWEGLCRALLSHPDFLFTRPRSLANTTDTKMRRHLQLMKIAQDLVARPPTQAEIARLDGGATLESFVDAYLASAEWRDFYFHRTRLYLESHGTPEQDEPARLWTYIAQTDRPFKEILTADYTIGADNKKATREAYYGKTGVLTMKGFIQGKPGLPHFNYPAQVCEKFLGYVFEVPDEVLQMRDGITAAATTDPNSMCYTCHKVLTPLAYQRQYWDDDGVYRIHDATGLPLDDSDGNLVASYPFRGSGLEAFATQAQNKERFVRTILQTHFVWYFGRELRYDTDERGLYKRLWDVTAKNHYALRPLIKAIVLSPEYLAGPLKTAPNAPAPSDKQRARMAKLARFHQAVGAIR